MFSILLWHGLSAQSLITASPDVSICAPNSTTLSATVNQQVFGTLTYNQSNIAYNPDPFTVGTQVFLGDDQFSGIINIGFNFCFYGNTYNQILISSNNYVSFDLTNANGFSPWSIPGPVPSAMNPMNTVLGPWQDINPGVGGQVYYNVAGTAPFRRFVVSYLNIPMFSCTGLLYSSQIILYETTNAIETHILNKPLCTTWNNGQAIHSLHNQTGTVADVVPGRNAPTQWTTSNEGYRFTPAGPPNFTVNWLANNVVVGTGTTLTVSPTVTTSYVAQLVYGCTNDAFTDTVVVTAASNAPTPITGVITACPGDTATYSVPFSPTATYTWTVSNAQINSGQGTSQILVTWQGSGPGSIQVQISDNGCNSTGNLSVTVGQVVPVSFTGLSPAYCFTFQQVNLTGSPTGGVFSGPGISGNAFNPMSSGAGTHAIVYSLTLPGNCSTPDTQMVQVISPITLNTIGSNQTICAPGPAAQLTGSVPSGGTGSFTYQWQSYTGSAWVNVPGETQMHYQPSGFNTGQYRRVAGGATPCPTVNSSLVQVTVHQLIGNNDIGNNQTLCSSQLPGVLTGTLPTGGNGSYSYLWQTSPDGLSWSNAAQPNSQANYTPGNVLTNTWFRRIVNSGVCAAHTSGSVLISIILQTSLTVQHDTICEGQTSTLTAIGLPAGGVYTWYTNPIQNTPGITVNPQVTTTYRVQYDVGGCTSLDSSIVTVYPLPAPVIQLSGNQNFCPGDSVILSALPAGGSYVWSDGSTGQSIVVYTSGTYSVQVTDPNGCPAASAPVGLVRSNLQVSLNIIHNTCVGACDGKAQAVVTGGISPYQYQWSSSPLMVSGNASSLCAGMHTLTVTDAAQCSFVLSFMINDPPVLNITANIMNVSCFGQADGSIALSGNGGTPPYAYALNSLNFGPQSTFSPLASGNYTGAVRDANQCIQQVNLIVVQPPQLSVTVTYTTPLCNGDQNGTATAIPSGGTPGYSWQWLHGGTSDGVQNLATGTYVVQVTDVNQCTASTQVFIPEPTVLTATASGFDLTCNTPPENGIASAFASGGTMPYYFAWNTGANPNASYNTGMPAGTWQVQVSDANACTTYATVVLNAPVLPGAVVSRDTHFCAGSGGVPVWGSGVGGQSPYTYLWTPNNGSVSDASLQSPWVNPDTTTTYFFQVIDDAGCSSTPLPVRVTVFQLPVVDAGPDVWYCDQGPGVFISGNIITPPGSYDVWWSPSNGLFCDTCLTTYANPGSTQIYTLYARNRNTGCTSDSTTLTSLSAVVVEVRPRPVVSAGPDTTICLGGSANLCGTAGNAGPVYTWQWQPNMHMPNHTIQCPVVTPPHTFTWFVITGSNGCYSIADSVTVFVSLLPQVDAGNVFNICSGDSVELQGLVQSGLAQQYRWTPGSGLSDSTVLKPMASPAQNTWYYLRAWNQGCQGPVDSVQVLVHAVPIAEAGRDTIVCGEGQEIQLLGNIQYSGNQPVYYNWQPGNLNGLQPVIQPGETQVYVLEVSAGAAPNICRSIDSVLISVLPAVEIELTADTNIICGGGMVRISVEAGVGGAGFFWTPDPGNQQQGNTTVMVSPDVSTTYYVVADEAGCRDTASWSIQVHPEVRAFFNPSQVWGCVPFDVQVQNLSMNAHAYVWNFGDGSPLSNEKEPFHTYDSSGVYQISMIAIGTGGCRDTMIFDEYVRISDSLSLQVYLKPEAPLELTLPMKPIRMYTEGAPLGTEYVWYTGDGAMHTGEEAFHIYKDTGTYYISFQAEHLSKCKTERTLGPIVIKAAKIFIPNVFTPNGDGVQDVFRIDYTGDERFSLVISDRWGVQWFTTQNVQEGWDGKSRDGRVAAEGVYYYAVEMGRRKEIGSFTLLR